jgi:hypothetical protein
MELDSARNEVFRKVGRNLLLFQELELDLRFLVTHGKFSGGIADMEELSKRREGNHMKTMGMVVGDYLNIMLDRNAMKSSEQIDPDKFFLSLDIGFDSDEEGEKRFRESLESLVQERNDLVHHFLEGIEFDSIGSWHAAGARLDSQSSRIIAECKFVSCLAGGIRTAFRELLERLEGDESPKPTGAIS